MVYHSVTALLWISQQHIWQIRVRPLCLALFFIVAFYSLAGLWAGNEMGSVFCKKWKVGGVFGKKVDFSSMRGALCTVSVFFILHFAYLGPQRSPPVPTGLSSKRSLYSRIIHHIHKKRPLFIFE